MRGLSRDVSLRVSRASVICYPRRLLVLTLVVCCMLATSRLLEERWRSPSGSIASGCSNTKTRRNAIGVDVVPDLTDEHLREMGLPLGHRLKLLKAIAALRAGPASLSGPAVPTSESVEGERRQVTVLFADLAGYTVLSNELDPEEAHAVLEGFFALADRLVGEHGGSIDKHIGDCVMAVFGAPIAHGNDAERAVRAALAIRDAMPDLSAALGRPLGVHIGVAGGQVVASRIGSPSHREYTVTGETVNLAARLTDEAAPGEILISEKVWRALPGRLEGDEVGALVVKGFKTPVFARRLLELRSAATTDGIPLVGRQFERQSFLALLQACRQTGQGGAIYLRGEAGIGKTRLVEEFRTVAGCSGFACHAGFVLDLGAASGRAAITALSCARCWVPRIAAILRVRRRQRRKRWSSS